MDHPRTPGPRETDRPDPLLGATLGGRYRVERCVGAGSMGRVYRASDLEERRVVAVKVLAPEHARNPELVARLDREVRATQRLQHPNVVGVYQHGLEPDGRRFLVLEFLDGVSLEQVILTDAPMPIGRIARIGLQIARALDAAHARNIVHRDLKPDNVMLVKHDGAADVVKILDFGLAQLVDEQGAELTMNGVRVGTPHYMAPEYLRGFVYDARSDLYALGVLLFELTTGVAPFTEAPPQLFVRQLESDAPSIAERRPECPAALVRLVARLLARDPADRPQRAADVAAALQPLVSPDSPALPPVAVVRDEVAGPVSLPANGVLAARGRRGAQDAVSVPPAGPASPPIGFTTLEITRNDEPVRRDTLQMALPSPKNDGHPESTDTESTARVGLETSLIVSGCVGLVVLAGAALLFLTASIIFLSTR
jgi:serine/threonine protein kinase